MSDTLGTFHIDNERTIPIVGSGCANGVHTHQQTTRLRWLSKSKIGRPEISREQLQQASVCPYCGDIKWSDIPTEIENS